MELRRYYITRCISAQLQTLVLVSQKLTKCKVTSTEYNTPDVIFIKTVIEMMKYTFDNYSLTNAGASRFSDKPLFIYL